MAYWHHSLRYVILRIGRRRRWYHDTYIWQVLKHDFRLDAFTTINNLDHSLIPFMEAGAPKWKVHHPTKAALAYLILPCRALTQVSGFTDEYGDKMGEDMLNAGVSAFVDPLSLESQDVHRQRFAHAMNVLGLSVRTHPSQAQNKVSAFSEKHGYTVQVRPRRRRARNDHVDSPNYLRLKAQMDGLSPRCGGYSR